MNLEELANEVFAKLESLAIEGFELGQELVMKEIIYQIWLNHFLLWLGVIFLGLGIAYYVLLALIKINEWWSWNKRDDIMDHGIWFAGCFLFGIFLLAGLVMVPVALVEIKHLEFNPVYYVLKVMLN